MRDLPLSVFDGLELKVTLRHIEPAIWRALRVPARLTLAQLHDVLQVAFGWTKPHLHDFTVGDIRFSSRDLEDEMFSVDERGVPLGAVGEVGSTFLYRYDYGDDWEHDVVVEGSSTRARPTSCASPEPAPARPRIRADRTGTGNSSRRCPIQRTRSTKT